MYTLSTFVYVFWNTLSSKDGLPAERPVDHREAGGKNIAPEIRFSADSDVI